MCWSNVDALNSRYLALEKQRGHALDAVAHFQELPFGD